MSGIHQEGGYKILLLSFLPVITAGCGGDARVELSAADALGAVAGEMAGTIDEYHGEVSRYDASRESAAIAAFVARVRSDAADEAALAGHTAAFEAALHKVRADREVEFTRRAAAMDNVSVLHEVSRGLARIGIQSLGLQDEMRRYLESWIDASRRRRADGPARSRRVATRAHAEEVTR